jgi:hypothetical protein
MQALVVGEKDVWGGYLAGLFQERGIEAVVLSSRLIPSALKKYSPD